MTLAPNQRPIGVFDSGIGGLSILMELRHQLPNEDLFYYADTANFPYGKRPREQVIELAEAAVRILVDRGAKLVVVACNSASTAAVESLRRTFSVPFIGMEPAVKPAASAARTGTIGVLATDVTLNGPTFARLVERFAGGLQVLTDPVVGLVESVERGIQGSEETERLLRRAVEPMLERGVDTIVLGCTHFPLARDQIERICGPDVKIIDSGSAVVRQTKRILEEASLLSDRNRPGEVEFLSSGDRAAFQQKLRRLLGETALATS